MTIAQIQQLRNALILLDACDPAVDAIYDLSSTYRGTYHEEYSDLNDAVARIRQSLTSKLTTLEALALSEG